MASTGPAAEAARQDVLELIGAKGHAVENAREAIARLERAFDEGALQRTPFLDQALERPDRGAGPGGGPEAGRQVGGGVALHPACHRSRAERGLTGRPTDGEGRLRAEGHWRGRPGARSIEPRAPEQRPRWRHAMRAHGGLGSSIVAGGARRLPRAARAAADPSPSPVARRRPRPAPRHLFVATGDPVDGWWWLRDAAGRQYATWSFAGRAGGRAGHGHVRAARHGRGERRPGVDATAWVTVGRHRGRRAGPRDPGAQPADLPGRVAGGRCPSAYQTLGTMTIAPDELSPTMEGLWVLVERRAPTGGRGPVARSRRTGRP